MSESSPSRTSTRPVDALDAAAEEAFDRLTRLASRLLAAPMAAVTLANGDRQYWKSAVGIPEATLAERELPWSENCFCRWIANRDERLVVSDTATHPLGQDNPIMEELSVRSFVGVPLHAPHGAVWGTFAVADREPRNWTEDELATVAELALSATTEIRLRHHAHAAAAERERFARLVNDVDAIVWEADAVTWQFTFVSERAEALLGYPVSRWLGEPDFWIHLLHPEDREAAVRHCATSAAAGCDHQLEYRVIAADGQTVWLRDRVRVIPGPDGQPAQLRGVMTVVTRQKEAELALIERERRFRSLIENSSDLITILSPDGVVQYLSPSVRRILGYEPDALLDTRAFDYVHPDDLPAVMDLFTGSLARSPLEPAGSSLYRFRARDGSWRWFESTATNLTGDAVIRGVVINSRDVSERVAIEAAYQRSEAQYRRIVETTSEGVWTTDDDGRITFVNRQMAEMIGYTPEEMIGELAEKFLPVEEYAPLEARRQRRRAGSTEQFDVRVVRPDGTEVWLFVSTNPLRAEDGSYLGALAVVSDITERKRSEDALREERRLSDTVHRIGELLAAELNLERLVRILTDEATVLVSAQVGAFFHATESEGGRSYAPSALCAPGPTPFQGFPLLQATDLFRPALAGEGVIRLDDVTRDPRFVINSSPHGLPTGHPPVRSYLAVPVLSRSGEVAGALFFGHAEPGVFTERHERILQGIAGQAAVALDNARLYLQARQAEEELREKVTILGAITEETPDAIYVKDREGRYLMMNPAGARILGRSVAEVIGRKDEELFPPEAVAVVTESDQPVLSRGVPCSYETLLTTPSGKLHVLTVKVPYRGEHGEVLGVIGISRDISERFAAEEALRASEARFRALYDQAGIGISIVNTEGRAMQTNAALQQMLGYSAEELTGRLFRDLTAPEDITAGWDHFLELVEGTRNSYQVEKRYIRKDGRHVWGRLTASAVRDGQGALQFVVGMVEDISSRRRAEQRNAEFGVLGQRLNTATTPRQAAEIVLDAADRLLGWDCCWLELFDEDRQTGTVIVSKDLVDDVRADTTPVKVDQPISGLTFRSVEQGGLLILRTPEQLPQPGQSGYTFFGNMVRPSASLMVVPIRAGNRFLGALSIQSYRFDAYTEEDVETLQALADYCTGAFERTQAEAAREHLQEQLIQAQKMEAVGRLAGGVAHDFNNMLGVINGYSELLLERPSLPPDVRHPLEEVKRAGERAASLTGQLLAFSRKQLIQPQVLDLREQLGNVDRLLRRLIGEDIALITRLPASLGKVTADPGQVEQVLMNLVLNARDAMPQGGSLIVALEDVRVTHSPPAARDAIPPGDYVRLTVQDTGCGMDEPTLAHIFEPFFTTKGVGQGTGLGLATVYGIVRQNEGYVEVESVPGEGSTFRIYLPRLAAPEPEPEPPTGVGGAPTGSETILVAEDEEMLRRLVCSVLRTSGYTVLEAESAGAALSLCRAHTGPIHLLLTDVVMPGGRGQELAVSALRHHPEMRVVYMSGYTDDAVVRHGVSSAEVHFLQKPFTPLALASEVRRVLDEAH